MLSDPRIAHQQVPVFQLKAQIVNNRESFDLVILLQQFLMTA
jgi:hypothetical protein